MGKNQFICEPYRRKYLKGYFSNMSKDDDRALCDGHVKDVLEQQGFHIIESPRSIYSVEKLFDALSKFEPGRVPSPRRGIHLDSGIRLATTCFKRKVSDPYLKPLSLNQQGVTTLTSNWAASAGLTSFGRSKAESMVVGLERAKQTLRGSKAPEPCIAYKRTQFDGKTRLVWGYPYAMTIIEGLIARPIIDHFKTLVSPMAFGETAGALGARLRSASYRKQYAYSIDMSSFDASVSASLIHESFKILRSWFDESEIIVTDCDLVVTVGQVFDVVEHYFIHTPIVMPDGKLYKGKRHGVPSGSFFTQFVDSVANVIIAGTISARFKLGITADDIFVLGDDLLMWSNNKQPLQVLSQFASNFFGVQFNASKSRIFKFDEPIHYLGRDWINGVPDLPTDEIVKRMVFPERWRSYDQGRVDSQVKLLIASYAGVYRSAYIILKRLFGSELYNRNGATGLEIKVYLERGRPVYPDDDKLSGLQRYLSKYVFANKRKGSTPEIATQFWL